MAKTGALASSTSSTVTIILVGGTGFGYRAFGARLLDEQIAVYALSNLGIMGVRDATLAVIPELV